jgi:ribA/ribD-fused uncharacterized protein
MQRIFFRDDFASPYAAFANGSDHPIELDGRDWPTAEHYFQAQKFHDPSLQEFVRHAATVEHALEVGQSCCLPLRGDWHEVREAIMYRALYAKFTQHAGPAEQLLSTDHAELICDSLEDAHWGAGVDRCGRNRLGILLMRLRAQLAASPELVLQAA